MSYTLPALVGQQVASAMFYTGKKFGGIEAGEIGLADQVVEPDERVVRTRALALEIASSAPFAVQSTRAQLRSGSAAQICQANIHECAVQREQFKRNDFKEGVAATREKRTPQFRDE